MDSIVDLPNSVAALDEESQRRFTRLFLCSRDIGTLKVPEQMKPWASQQFGAWETLRYQPILKVMNRLTFEGALFNKLRADRPMHQAANVTTEELLLMAAKEPFANVAKNTPEDMFGRIRGKHSTTASNVAKYDCHHGLVIFDNPDPLQFSEEEVISHFHTAMAWIGASYLNDREAIYPAIGWNCLWKAGASLVHGHLQTLLSKHSHYAAPEQYWKVSEEYYNRHGRDYFGDLFLVHQTLGLGSEWRGVRLFASLVPKKEKEVILLNDAADANLFSGLYRVLKAYLALGVQSFNVAVILPPLDGSWEDFPIIVKVVDRGNPASRTTDVAFVELYLGESVIESDPVKVWGAVKKEL